MFEETFAYGVNPYDTIRRLSLETIEPLATSKAMHNLWTSNVKLNRKVLTVNLLMVLSSINCGTNDVMFVARSMSKCSQRKGSTERFRKILMREKLNDALSEESHARKKFEICRNNYNRSVRKNTLIDNIFQNMMRQKIEDDWKEGKNKNKNKIDHLVSKWGKPAENMDENLRNIKYSDADLAKDICDKNESPVIYGNIATSENMNEALKMNPKFMTHAPINPWDMEVAVELGFTKYRYSQIDKNNGKDGDDRNDCDEETLNLETKTVDYGKIIATNLPKI